MVQVTTPPVEKPRTPPMMRAFVRETMETVVLALLLFFALRVSIQNFQVEGASMSPSIHPGEYVFVNRRSYLEVPLDRIGGKGKVAYPLGFPKRGDIIVFHAPGGQSRDFVKRVIGLPGDVVQVQAGQVLVNGVALDEPYKELDVQTVPPTRVPDAQVYVMGDNRPASNDSRAWGPVPVHSIIGRVWVRYWPAKVAKFFKSVSYASEGSIESSPR